MEITVNKKESTRKQVEDIMLDISWAKLAKKYFDRSPSWIYHKMDGIDGNGGEGGFSSEEKEMFKAALFDISERIRKAAEAVR